MAQQEMTPEQQEELRKKLESMSPEELKEFQKKQCIFCHIVSGKVAAKKVYEDDKVLAVLDINPANPGHILLMPKEHYMIMPQMPDNELSYIFIVAKHLSNAVLRALDVRGTNIIVANGGAAGQRAQHFMIHIIPRKEGDGVSFQVPFNKLEEKHLEVACQAVKKRLGDILGGMKEKPKTAQDILKEAQAKGKKVVEADFKEEEKEFKEEKAGQKEAKQDESRAGEAIEEKIILSKPIEQQKKEAAESSAQESRNSKTKKQAKQKSEAKKSSSKKSDGIDLDAIARLLNVR
jgi:histidine triad (HIT) family protein